MPNEPTEEQPQANPQTPPESETPQGNPPKPETPPENQEDQQEQDNPEESPPDPKPESEEEEIEEVEPVARNVSPTKEKEEAPEPPSQEESEEEDILPEEQKLIQKEVKKATAPLISQLQEQKDRAEVDEFLSTNKDFTPYKQSILNHLKHPAYSNVPVERLAYMIAGKSLLKLGAKTEREAREKAESSHTPGANNRPSEPGKTDWTKASKEAFEQKRREVLGMSG